MGLPSLLIISWLDTLHQTRRETRSSLIRSAD
ncbi:hypothetical protein Ae150APs1_6182 [Pseudonocardia sp. Ae150A_Ps1]|nr:hypothetical protein Ae150APs1_6182 [Pseudonocardia sp. Ae150A_Ps1]